MLVVQDAFNTWAKGKALTREVIIHTHVTFNPQHFFAEQAAIVVFHPEGEPWERTRKHLVAPVHDHPVPHIKVEEAQVTA